MKNYQAIEKLISDKEQGLAILIDPDKFDSSLTRSFLKQIPSESTHLFVGGSTVVNGETAKVIRTIKKESKLPVFIFPGDYTQITSEADAVLFLSLLSGRNPEYLIGQQLKSVSRLKNTNLEVIPTAYILIDGGTESAVARISETLPMSPENRQAIVDTAIAGQYMGAKLIYLEAGSGAKIPVEPEIIKMVCEAVEIPVIVGGGIRTEKQKRDVYEAGAAMAVMGTLFEESFN